jgi:5-hydroxyisourate hydrolase
MAYYKTPAGKIIGMSQVTTHILDLSAGTPAPGITVSLHRGEQDAWTEIARGLTNADGRNSTLLENGTILQPGIYKLRFETKDYFDSQSVSTFYPYVEIVFDVTAAAHYHVPLLLSPWGYSTYRGS